MQLIAEDSQRRWTVIHHGKRAEVCYGNGGSASGGLHGGAAAWIGEAVARCWPDPAAVGAGGDLRGWLARHGSQDRRRWVTDDPRLGVGLQCTGCGGDRKSTRLNSSHVEISYAVFCLKKKKKIK